jgi:rubrerythrin
MPAFANPFSGNIDKKINKDELTQAVRLDIANELEAIFIYDSHVQATDDQLAKKVLADIRDEEKAHVGELLTLLKHLDSTLAANLTSGESEVAKMMKQLGVQK